ncbi:hypothetical protein BKA80DRAFT_344204 [Phyllosticta citrichinensis]
MEPHPSANTAMGSGESSSSSTIPLMSPDKQARFSELVSIITTSAQALQDEFEWVSTTTWTQILDQMFPATGGVNDLAGNQDSLKRLLATVEASEIKKAGSKIFKDGPPPANGDVRNLTPDQRTTEWSLIMRFGDPRAPMNDDHYAYVAIALKRWWRFAAPVSLLRKARHAIVAQYKLVGHSGPGMLPFNTAVWQKATYDAQCDFLRELKRAGDAKGVLALESILGKTTRDDEVVFVRETKRSPSNASKTAAVQVSNVRETKCNPSEVGKITGAQQLEVSETRKRSKDDAKKTEQVEVESDSDSDIPASKRQKTARLSKPAPQVVEIDSDDEPIQTKRTQLRLVVKSQPNAEKSLIVKLPIKSAQSIPTKSHSNTAAPNDPIPQAVPTKQAPAQAPKRLYKYKVEAELTSSPRTNALISHLITCFAMQHRRVLTRFPWALEKLRRYAQGKEPHIKGPGQTSMLEIGFFEGKDLSWSISGFQLDRLTDVREKSKVEWEARQVEKQAQELAEFHNSQSNKDDNVSSRATQISDNTLQGSVQTDLNDNDRSTAEEVESGDNEAVEPQEHESEAGNVTVGATDNQAHGGSDDLQTESETPRSPAAGHEDVFMDAQNDPEEQAGSPIVDEDVHMDGSEDEHASSHDDNDSANGEESQSDTDKQPDSIGSERSYSSSGSGTDEQMQTTAAHSHVGSPVLTEEQIQTLQLFWGDKARQQRMNEEALSSSANHGNTSPAHSSAASANTDDEHASSHDGNAVDASKEEESQLFQDERSASDDSNYGSDAASNDGVDTEMQNTDDTSLDHGHAAMHTYDGNNEQDHQMQLLGAAIAADEDTAATNGSGNGNTKGIFGWLFS